jgi:hypothetical protein
MSSYDEYFSFLMRLADDQLLLQGDIPDMRLDIANAEFTVKELRRFFVATHGTESRAAVFYAELNALRARGFVNCDANKRLVWVQFPQKRSA